MNPSEDYRHLRPEDMQKFIPGVFRYERDSAIAGRAIEAHRFYLRTQVEMLRIEPLQYDSAEQQLIRESWNQALEAVLNLLKEPE